MDCSRDDCWLWLSDVCVSHRRYADSCADYPQEAPRAVHALVADRWSPWHDEIAGCSPVRTWAIDSPENNDASVSKSSWKNSSSLVHRSVPLHLLQKKKQKKKFQSNFHRSIITSIILELKIFICKSLKLIDTPDTYLWPTARTFFEESPKQVGPVYRISHLK